MTTAINRVVTFGEVLLRLSPPGDERLFQSPSLHTYWGGAEANVAVGVAALGASSTHVTRLPSNVVGDAAVRALRAEGVDMSRAQFGEGRMGAYFLERGADLRALSVVYDRAHSAFAQLEGDEFDWPSILAGASCLHISGVTIALGEGPYRAASAAIDAAVTAGVPVSIDLNFRPALWIGRDPRPLMQPLVRKANILIGNPGAVKLMLGIETAGVMPEPAPALHDTARAIHHDYGCQQIALTQRDVVSASVHGWQAHCWNAAAPDALHSSARYDVALIDRVGGGDAFAAALLVELLRGALPADAVRFAAAAGALKLTIPGDFNRVRRADVERLLTPTH